MEFGEIYSNGGSDWYGGKWYSNDWDKGAGKVKFPKNFLGRRGAPARRNAKNLP